MKKVYKIILYMFIIFVLSACTSNKEVKNTTGIMEKKEFLNKKNSMVIKGDNFLLEGKCSAYITIDSKSLSDNKKMTLEIDNDNDGKLEYYALSKDTPNGIRILAVKNVYGINLNDFKYTSAFDDYGDIKSNYSIQLTCCDLNNDNIDEILVSVGDSLIDMETLVYRLSNKKDNPFLLVGRICGQEKMTFNTKDCAIYAPYGSRGPFEKYTYKNNKIIQTK